MAVHPDDVRNVGILLGKLTWWMSSPIFDGPTLVHGAALGVGPGAAVEAEATTTKRPTRVLRANISLC